ncbi:hypothetical protein DFJ58DRAFT_848501 [Suillus subalutaceus]|uniref:uncharacterized protein n=1 Tax=Suillus subalutaceus TaxID=48586 RepID=UPI001B872F15|nr:uncharacterized protein DFJ58DRAFT_848501 [Suillus subalutaceus]KAG1830267.1 hypothetical protein DFJ58DRAFT_848501 [Suillus subalutaceus]
MHDSVYIQNCLATEKRAEQQSLLRSVDFCKFIFTPTGSGPTIPYIPLVYLIMPCRRGPKPQTTAEQEEKPCRRGPKPWTTAEQEEFLLSKLSKRKYTRYSFMSHERNKGHMGVPLEGDLTTAQAEVLTDAKEHHKEQLKVWYRWQTNVACLARAGGSKGMLDVSATLSGGDEVSGRAPQEVEVYSQIFYDEHVKGEADAAIKAEGIMTCGRKLAKRKDLTRTRYAVEDDGIKAEVQARHQEALEIWKKKCELAKAGCVQEVEQEEKIRAFSELGAHLDHIFRHLSHKTGGLKFTCIAGGRHPTTGEIIVLDYHLGETEMGVEFSGQYAGFGEVQTAYADFIKLAMAHDDKMLALALDPGTTSDEVPNKSEEIFWEGSSEEKAVEEDMGDIELGMNSLYQFNVPDDQEFTVKSTPSGARTTTMGAPIVPLTSDQLDISNFDMTQTVDNIFASLLLGPYDPFTMTNTPPCLEDLDFSFMYDSSDLSSYQNSPLVFHVYFRVIQPCLVAYRVTHRSRISITYLPTTPPGASTSGINMADPNLPNLLTGVITGLEELKEGPHQTSQPLTYFNHLLPTTPPGTSTSGINMADPNISNLLTGVITGQEELKEGAHVRLPISVDKENNKRQKADAAGAGLQSRNCSLDFYDRKQKHV